MESLFPDGPCPKCGSAEVRWFWHLTNYGRANARQKGCGRGDHSQPSGEHLHAYCQRCHFDWFEDVLTHV